MRFVNYFRTSGGFILLALIVTLPGLLVNADYVILESATMGPPAQPSGSLVDDTQFIGWRFYVSRHLKVTKIGGHLAQSVSYGNFFGAIVYLSSSSDLPNGYPFTAGEVVASTVFNPGLPSSDYRTPLSVTLSPGTYGLVFGTDALGSSYGYGGMPTGGQTSHPQTTYFVFLPGSGWFDVVPNNNRFVVEGNTDYCDASGSDLYHYIKGVEVGSINNIPTDNHLYADYTSLSTTMAPATSYPVIVTRGNPWHNDYDKCGLWVDWNQDEDFYDYGEAIPMSIGVDPCTFAGTITPPAGAVLGNTRMRVRITYDQIPVSCGGSTYGEVEDYTINVSDAPSFVMISGYVKTSGGIGIKDVLVSFSTGGTDTTDVDGYYERTQSTPWSGTITPGKAGWTFEPVNRAYVNLTTDISNADFTGAHTVYGGGKGTAADPYLIFTASQLNTIGLYYVDWHSHFKLMADIDLVSYTGDSFNIIGGNLGKFEGVFDGNGKRIYNFTYTSVFPDIHIKGLFKHLDGANAEIKDLGLVNPNLNGVTGTEVGILTGRLSGGCSISGCYVEGGSVSGSRYLGGLVGSVENGTISNCYATCDVSGNNDYAGGLVGENKDDGTISNSYAKGTVSGNSDVGGLVGHNRGTLSDCYAMGDVTGEYGVGGLTGAEYETVIGCYATGSVTGIQKVGGLIGKMGSSATVTNCHSSGNVFGKDYVGGLVGEDFFSPISYCYSIGKVTGTGTDIGGLIGYTQGTITACFWDVDRSGMDTSSDGTGLTTAEMQMQSTYTDAGWDFSTPVWKMNCEGMSYPKLNYWQPVLGDFGCPDGVDMRDFAVIGAQWQQLPGAPSADIAPEGGDGIVDFSDLAAQVDNWLSGF